MKLSLAYLESQVVATEYDSKGTFTVCTITTKSGTKLVGTSACLDPKNYNKAIGEEVARKNAVEQLWQLEGYFWAKCGFAQVDLDVSEIQAVQVTVDSLSAPAVY